MKKVDFVIASLAVAVMASGVTGQSSRVQQPPSPPDVLERKVQGDSLEYDTTTDVFTSILGTSKIPGGTARAIGCFDDTTKQAWRPSGSSAGEALGFLKRAFSAPSMTISDFSLFSRARKLRGPSTCTLTASCPMTSTCWRKCWTVRSVASGYSQYYNRKYKKVGHLCWLHSYVVLSC